MNIGQQKLLSWIDKMREDVKSPLSPAKIREKEPVVTVTAFDKSGTNTPLLKESISAAFRAHCKNRSSIDLS